LTLTLDRVEVTLVRICGRGLPTYQIRWKSEKLLVDVRTYGRTHLSSNLLGHRRGDDLKIRKFCNPISNVAIDESLQLYKGQLLFTQHVRAK